MRRLRHQLGHLVQPHSHEAADKVDSALESSREGMRALWISLAILGVTAVAQAVVVICSGSVALLGDTLHNFADALTAVPLGIAFMLGRRAPTRRYTYGYGRAEDLAGIVIVLVIAASAVLAGYEAVRRLADPQRRRAPVGASPPPACVGFVGNELGRPLPHPDAAAGSARPRWSPTACTPAPTASPRWPWCSAPAASPLGWQLADPIVGLLITVAILLVLRDAAREVYRRLMDAVDPALVDRAEQALAEAPGVLARRRAAAALDRPPAARRGRPRRPADLTLAGAHDVAVDAEHHLMAAIPSLTGATLHPDPAPLAGRRHHSAVSPSM